MRRLAIACVLVAVACNAITGLDEDFVLAPDGGGAANDAAANDGTTPGDDATANEGGMDATGNDAASDAPSDGGFTCDAANVVFCTDFETDASWTDEELVSGVVTFELDAGVAHTRGMHAHTDDAGGVSRRAALWKKIAGTDAKTYAHYDVEFDFMIAAKSFPYAALGIFATTQPAGGGGLRYYGVASFGDKTLEVVDDQPRITPDGIGVDDTFGTWHHALATLDRENAGTYAVALKVDGTTVDARTGFDFGDAQTAELRIGILFTSTSSGTMDLYVDNVLVRRKQ